MEVLKNRSRHVDEWVGLAEWAVQVGTNMARAHPVIGHEEPGANLLTWEDIQWATTFDDITQVPSHGGDAQLFRGQDQWLRALYAGIMLVTLLGAVFARRPAVLLATGGLAAGMFVTFLFRSEAMVRRLLGHPREGLEVSWQIGAHMALLGFAGMLLTGGILLRARR